MELTLDQALQKGVEAHKAGKVQEAERYYTAILKANPKHPDANHNMGILAIGVGKVETALPFFKTALDANPSIAQFWISYIDALIKADRITDAKAVFDQAKSKDAKGDGFDQLHERLSVLKKALDGLTISENANSQEPPREELNALMKLYDQNRLQQVFYEAKRLTKRYTKSLTLWNLTGASAAQLGQLDQAIFSFNKAISIKPDYAEAYNNMGIVLKDRGNLEEAIEAFNKALCIKPDFSEAYNNMGIALERAIFSESNQALQKVIISILDQKTIVRPKDIAKAVISLVKHEAQLRKYLEPKHISKIKQIPIETVISDLNKLPLLLKLMSVCPLPDLKLEALFTYLRSAILNILDAKDASPELLRFQSALALQCFTNEYVYSHSEEEEKMLQALEKIVNKAFKNNKQPSPQVILALASYKALNHYGWCNLLVATDPIQEVIKRQIEEPQKEKDLKSDLSSLEGITNKVSSEVREQYEESPYPRWVNLGLHLRPKSISKVVDEIKIKLHDHKIKEVQSPNILIAGCGTGQHSIGTAARFKSSKVLAIDLSLSSLAYAKRKTEELAVENIEYMQADILDLQKLNRQFDIVESTGVLHHMADPIGGWRALTDCLKPGGLMKIGLYSELARQHIGKIRQENINAGIGSSDVEMRSFRDIINKSEKDHHKLIIRSPDFYSLSTLKDLLFHVQEHRFTMPKIKSCLLELGLKFCGFEANEVVSEFKIVNTGTDDFFDLDKWQKFEESNPRIFAGMYQFWCQKEL